MIMTNLCKLFGQCCNQQAKSEIQSFAEALETFRKDTHQLSVQQINAIQEPLAILEDTFSQEVRLQHPRQIYPIYEALNVVTNEVAKSALESLGSSWGQVLETLHNRKIYKIKLGTASFDTTIAQQILTQKLTKTIVTASIDLKNSKNHQEVVDYIYATDQEAFGSCFQRGFIDEIMKSPEVLCLVARDEKNDLVGILWGFFVNNKDQQLFHFWEVLEKPLWPT